MHVLDRVELQIAREHAFRDGEYELDEWEGFTCPECEWRGLSARGDFDADDDLGLECICSECGHSPVQTSDNDTDWSVVEEKIPEEYLSGEAMETDHPECGMCGRDVRNDNGTTIDLGTDGRYYVHEGCANSLYEKNIESYYWYDTLTEEHFDASLEYLNSLDKVGHAFGDYRMGEIWVHTNYANSGIVREVVDHFNARVVSAGVKREDDKYALDCTKAHGTCFEVFIDFSSGNIWRPPADEIREMYQEGDLTPSAEFIDEEDKIFDADFDRKI